MLDKLKQFQSFEWPGSTSSAYFFIVNDRQRLQMLVELSSHFFGADINTNCNTCVIKYIKLLRALDINELQ